MYNFIISGLAHLGEYVNFISWNGLLGLKFDKITFVAVLSASGHCDLVDVGQKLFDTIIKDDDTGTGCTLPEHSQRETKFKVFVT